MNKYAIIDVGGKQLRVEQGRFYDVRHLAPVQHTLTPNEKISINRVLLIRHGSSVNLGYPWLDDAAVKGRILHGCFEKKLVIQRIQSKTKNRRTFGYREKMTRFVVDSIHFAGENLNRS
uniref:Large ribosomal subunit protein bL21c n=1 Tax=Davallia solida var. fejeensis TaxID=328198 RepID=A0A5B9RPF7_DAVSF|nr:ribosomal protein L21 [Davallia solida var. fejeensis]QEG58017.1 ribosomal protein L21 [Davallia solida var. fejeensis]